MAEQEVNIVSDAKCQTVCGAQDKLPVVPRKQLERLARSCTHAIGNRRHVETAKKSLIEEIEDLKFEVKFQKSLIRPSQQSQNQRILCTLNTELSCAICCEILVKAVTIECGHIFCSHCISKWFNQQHESRSCPTCRSRTFMDGKKNTKVDSTIDEFFKMLPHRFQSSREQHLTNRLAEERNKVTEDLARIYAAQQTMNLENFLAQETNQLIDNNELVQSWFQSFQYE